MANLLNWLGRDVVAPIQRDVVAPVQRAINNPNTPVLGPLLGADRSIVQGASNVIQAPVNAVKLGAADLTNNAVARQNALNALMTAQHSAGSFAQGIPRGLVQLEQSIRPGGIRHPVVPTNPFSRTLLGNQPVNSIQQDYSTARNNGVSKTNALTGAGISLAQDIPIGLGAAKLAKGGIKAGLKFDAAQNQLGAVGKNVKLSSQDIASLQKQGFDAKTIAKMSGPGGAKVAPPDVSVRTPGSPQVPKSKGSIIPQVSSEGKITSLTSPMNRLNRLGQGGQGALQLIRDKEIGARVHTQQLADIAKPFFNLSKDQQAAAIKVHKGEFTTKDPTVQAGADSLRTMFQQAHQRAINAGVKVGNQGANYFPQSYPKEWFKDPKSINKAAQQLVANGKAPDLETAVSKLNKIKIEGSVSPEVYGHFKPRTTDIPGIENAHTVTNYIRGASDNIAQAEHFGPKNRLLLGHVATAIKNGEDATALRGIVSNYLHPTRPGTGAINTTLNAYQKGLRVLQLPRAAISHGPQGIQNTASDIGYKQYFKAMGQKIKMTSVDQNFLNNHGFRSEKVAPPEGLAGKATAPGLGHLIQFHRDVAALGGRNMALHAAEQGDVAALKNMAVSGKLIKGADGKIKLTEAQQAQAGHFEANKSIGSSSRLESPQWAQSQGGKLIGMYRKMYTFKQAERIGNWLSEARNGNPGPLIKYLAIGVPVSGAAVALAKDEIKNPGANPTKDKGKLALDTMHNSGIGSIGYGTLDSAINAASHNYGNDSRWSNAASAVSPGAGFAVQTGQHIAKGVHGNWTPLERQGLQSLPVGGTALANKVAPSPQFIKADSTGSTGSPQQREANAKAEVDSLKKSPNLGNGYSLQQLSNGKYAYTLDGDTTVHQTADKNKARLDIAKAAFGQDGGSYKIVGNNVLRKAADGSVSVITKDSFDYKVGTATLTAQKNAGDLTGWLNTANSQLDLITKQLKDPNIDPLDALTLQNDATAIQNNIAKYSDYGGFTKGTSAASRIAKSAKATTSFKTATTAKAPAKPKGVSVKKLAAPKFKATATRKLAVSKIPTNYLNKKLK